MIRLAARALPTSRALAALAVLAGFALRALRLGYQELRGDETFGYFFSLNDLGRIVGGTLELREPHPVASYWIQHLWLQGAGHSEYALRYAGLWFGALGIALVYVLARRIGLSGRSAALAAWLLALSPYALWHSQDARMYTMSLALTLLSSTLAIAFFRRPRFSAAAAYVLASLFALHTHYFAAFVIVAQNAWVAWRTLSGAKPDRFGRPVRYWLGAQFALLALFLPWLIAARDTLTGYRGNGDSPALFDALARTARALTTGEMAPLSVRTAAALIAAAILILLAIGALRRRATAPRDLAFAALLLIVPLVATWISSRGRPIFNERYLVAALPGLLLLLAASVDRRQPRPERDVAAALTGLLLVLSLAASAFYLLDPAYSKSRGWREVAGVLAAFTDDFDREKAWVLVNGADPTLWYYYPQQETRWAIPFAEGDAAGAEQVTRELVRAGVERVVVPLESGGDEIARAALASRYAIVYTVRVAGREVIVGERPPAAAQSVGASFAGGLRLESVGLQPGATVDPGSLLGIHLQWSGSTDRLPPGLKITLQLLDPSGALVAQTDAPLAIAAGRSAHGLRLPESLPSGAYRLILALYNPDAPGQPRLLTEDERDAVTLSEIRVN